VSSTSSLIISKAVLYATREASSPHQGYLPISHADIRHQRNPTLTSYFSYLKVTLHAKGLAARFEAYSILTVAIQPEFFHIFHQPNRIHVSIKPERVSQAKTFWKR